MIKHPVYFKERNLGQIINTNANDFDAVLSGDGNSIIYMTSLKFYDALFYSTKKDGGWSTPVNITPDIRSDGDYYPTGMSFDGTKLLLTWNDKFNSNLFISSLVDGKWTPAKKLPKQINTKYWESHASFSPDGETLYFTSNRTGGYGGLDIYKSTFDNTLKTWGSAINIGPVINTQFNEETPFICEDNKTLYFASQGHKTMGGFDIFSSTLKNNENWSEPKNLGYPLNTSDDDMFFLPLDDGIKGIISLAGQKDNFGGKDIYLIEIYSDKNPRPVEISGKITLNGAKPGENSHIQINIQKTPDGNPVTLMASGPDGLFSTIQKEPGTYHLSIKANGFEVKDQTFILPDDYSTGQLVLNENLKGLEINIQPIVLHNVYFDLNSSYLSKTAKANIKELVTIMKENPDLQVELNGYTDITGPIAFNKWLAKRRAERVGKFLEKQGIDKTRFSIIGRGPSNFLAINRGKNNTDAPAGRKFNRRVEVHIISTTNKAIVSEKPDIPENLKFKK